MKKIKGLLIVFLITYGTQYLAAQENEYSEVVNIENITADRLFSLISTWYANEFKGESSVQYSDKETHTISGDYVFIIRGANQYTTSSTVLVEARDGRYRIICNNAQQVITGSAWVGGVTGNSSIKNRDYKPSTDKVIKQYFIPKWKTLAASLKKHVLASYQNSNW